MASETELSIHFLGWALPPTPFGLVEFKSDRIILGDTPSRLYNSRPRLQFVPRERRCVRTGCWLLLLLLLARDFVLCFHTENSRIFSSVFMIRGWRHENFTGVNVGNPFLGSHKFRSKLQYRIMSTDPDPWITFSGVLLKHEKPLFKIFTQTWGFPKQSRDFECKIDDFYLKT